MEILLVVFGQKSVKISGELGEEVASFIDDEYVSETLDKEYLYDIVTDDSIDLEESQMLSEEETGAPEDITYGASPGNRRERVHLLASQAMVGSAPTEKADKKKDSLEDVLKGIYTDSFEKHLQKLINKKGLKNSEVYAAANISKQYFSKLIKGQVKPSKEKVLALAVGLQLNMDETVDFLKLAGYALSPISQTDAVVEYFIEHEDYNVLKIDIVLFDYGLDPLSKG